MTLSGHTALIAVIGGIASLCLNLFLVGLLVGGFWHDHPHRWGGGLMGMHDGAEGEHGWPGAGKGGFSMMPVPPEIRAELAEVLAPHEAEIEKARSAVNDARLVVGKALATEPFDPAAFKAALENLQQQRQATQKLMQDLMLEAAPKLKPELRQRWAQRWMAPRMDGPPPASQPQQ